MSLPHAAFAFRAPPEAPSLTGEALAREYEPEFRQDFERYFSDATATFGLAETLRRYRLVDM